MKLLKLIVLLLLLVAPGTVLAQDISDSPVRWSAKPPVEPIRAGASFEIRLDAAIEGNYHMYSATQPPGGPITTRFKLLSGEPFQIMGAVRQSQPQTAFDPNFGIPTEFFVREAQFWIPLKTSATAKPGEYEVSIQAYYQVCDDKICLPPKGVPIPVKVKILEGPPLESGTVTGTPGAAAPAASTPAPAFAPVGTAAEVERARSSGFLPFLWLAMSMGALSLATPCVFPMIPITVSYFTKSAETSWASGLRLALVYCLGIIFTFTGLGLGLAALLGATGINQFAANPWVNLLITAVFMGFALNLFGLYQIGIPSSVLTKLSSVGSGSGYASTLLMGLTFTLTSFTCTVPFVGTVLVATAQGDWLWPALGMLGFSVVFAAPFFVLALAPRMLVAMPKSGGWLNSVKVTMGFLEVAAAMKFISNVDLVWRWNLFTREVVLSIWLAICVLAAVYLLGKFRLPHDSLLDHLGVLRMTAAMSFLALGFYLFTGLMGASLGEIDAFLPPRTAGAFSLTSGGHGQEITWNTNLESAMAQARQEKKLVFIDFTGYTCTNCRWMEANIFTRPAVVAGLQKYVRVQLYTDGEGKEYEDNQKYQKENFGTVALPLYAILDPEGRKVSTFPGMTRNAAEFEQFLSRPLATATQAANAEGKQPD